MMAGDLGLGKSQWLSKEETRAMIQNVNQEELRGGVVYHDGQFDDARMAITLALTADSLEASLLNYAKETRRLLPEIAQIMAEELKKDSDWVKNEINQTKKILNTYTL